jgi:hypothetical protein
LSDVSVLLCLGRLSLADIFGNPTKRLEKVRSSRRKKTLRSSKQHRIKHAILAGIKGLRQLVQGLLIPAVCLKNFRVIPRQEARRLCFLSHDATCF